MLSNTDGSLMTQLSVKVLNFRKENYNLFIFQFRFLEFGAATSSQVYEMIFGEMQFFWKRPMLYPWSWRKESNFNFFCGLVYLCGWLLSPLARMKKSLYHASHPRLSMTELLFWQIVWTSIMPMLNANVDYFSPMNTVTDFTVDKNTAFVASINIYSKNNLECTQL